MTTTAPECKPGPSRLRPVLSIAQEAHRKNRCFSPTQAISSNHGGFMLLEVSKILYCFEVRVPPYLLQEVQYK